MSSFRVVRPAVHGHPRAPTRFAVGKDTGSLYLAFMPVAGAQHYIGTVLVGRGSLEGREGSQERIMSDELLPLGTTVEITI
jgi:hypothetical protein